MGLLDILFGRSKPLKAKGENLFAISTAYVTLITRLSMEAGRQAGICFRPLDTSSFQGLEETINRLLELSAKETGSKVKTTQDSYGFQWVIVEDKDFEDLVATIHMVSTTIAEQGFEEWLLAAVFPFYEEGRPLYWIYNYKRGKFYPFAPKVPEKDRDNSMELRLRALVEKELPIEPRLEQWYALWGIPF